MWLELLLEVSFLSYLNKYIQVVLDRYIQSVSLCDEMYRGSIDNPHCSILKIEKEIKIQKDKKLGFLRAE